MVSVITIFFNAERFIQEAVESIFAQTYENWELLLVDDGSSDGSTDVALRYAERYPEKVRYLEHENHQNHGMSASRNLGICNAKGVYIAFLDADDVWLPQKLEQQVEILDSKPDAAMVYGPAQYWFSWTGKPEDINRDSLRKIGMEGNVLVKPPALLTLVLINQAHPPCTCSVLVRRELIENVGGFDEGFRGMFEDQAFLAKAFLNAPVYVTNECLDRYRQHQNSNSAISTKTGEYHHTKPNPARFIFLNWLADYMSEHGFKNTEAWKILQLVLWLYPYPILYSLLRRAQPLVSHIRNLQNPKDYLKKAHSA